MCPNLLGYQLTPEGAIRSDIYILMVAFGSRHCNVEHQKPICSEIEQNLVKILPIVVIMLLSKVKMILRRFVSAWGMLL
jgi:hypothetical protein